jgi:hypothetical protein
MTTKNIRYGNNSLLIKKFDIKSMPDFVTIAMIAKRASGKSYLTREILFHMRDIPTAIAISKTEKLNKFYTEFIPELFIYDEYSSCILDKIYQRQEQILSQDKVIELLKKHKVRYPHIALAQAYVETNLGKTGIGKPNKNLFGMRVARQRSTLAIGEENNFAVFDNWIESVLDYTLWQDAVFGVNSNTTEEQYYVVLDQIYCEGNHTYSQKVKQIINNYKLKNKF